MPKRTEAHEIDKAAQLVLEDQWPKEWVLRKHDPDYGIDYVAERFEPTVALDGKTPTGRQVAIQLKGSKSLRRSDTEISFSLSTDHLKYYVDKCLMPVFLVVVDVREKIGYWMFLQKYEKQLPAEWRAQGKVTVRIPLVNRLTGATALAEAVEAAQAWVGIRHVGGNLRAERERLEKLDPRFSIEITATERGPHHVLHAKEPVQITLRGPKKPLQRLLDRGGPVRFGPNELSVVGSPLLENQFSQGGILEWRNRGQVDLKFTAQDDQGNCRGQVDRVTCAITGGMKVLDVRGELPGSPLRAHLGLRNVRGRPKFIPCRITFTAARWQGQLLLELGYFDQIHSLYKGLSEGAQLRTDLLDKGNIKRLGVATVADVEAVAFIYRYLDVVWRAREVARQLALNPTFPGDLTREEVGKINDLYELLNGTSQPWPGAELNATMLPAGVEGVIELSRANPGEALTITSRREFEFLGIAVELPTAQTFTHCYLASNPDELRRAAASAGPDGDVPVKWKGTDETVVTMRRLEAVEGLPTAETKGGSE